MSSPAPAPDVSARARRRIARRLVPYLFIIYVIAYLDRVNVAYAALEMQRDLGFSDKVFGFGAGLFFIGYFILEIPGSIIVERWSARRWMARIMITWGLITILTAFMRTASQFYTARFLLGLAEAGFFPGIIVYLTHWFRYEDRAKAVAGFFAATAVANIVGSPVAGLLLGVHWYGIEGWRWLFIVEGIPAVIFGVITLAYLTDWPREAHWLHEDEREWITSALERERIEKKAGRHYTILEALRHREVLLLCAIYLCSVTAHYGFILWLPTILQRASGLPNFTITMLAALPYVAGVIAMQFNGWHSDRSGERRWHTAGPLFLCSAVFLLLVLAGTHFVIAMVLVTVLGAFMHSYQPCFWALATLTLSESAAAASIGLINSVGNLGGFFGPSVVGWLVSTTHTFTAGHVFLLACMFSAAVLVLFLRTHRKA